MAKRAHIEKLGFAEEGRDEATHSGNGYFVICARVRPRRRTAADVENETLELRARYAVAKMLIVEARKEGKELFF
jgi:hypothetical protein